MRFMVLVKSDAKSEAGVLAGREAAFRDGQVQRGADQGRRDADGRRSPRELEGRARSRIRPKTTVIDGPFAEAKELVAGYWTFRRSRKPTPSSGSSERRSKTVKSRFVSCTRCPTS